MKAEFIKYWTCPPTPPGNGGTLLPRSPNPRTLPVPLAHEFAKPYCGRESRIWRVSNSCGSGGAGGVHEILRGLSVGRSCQRLPLSGVRREGRRGHVGQCLPRCPAASATLAALAPRLRL